MWFDRFFYNVHWRDGDNAKGPDGVIPHQILSLYRKRPIWTIYRAA